MATMNGVTFKKNIVPSSKFAIKCPKPMVAKKITVHETDNMAHAASEINYMNGNNKATSYHVAVDEKEAVQGLPFNRNGWHSGDGYNGYGNRNTIGVEICKNYDRNRNTRNLIEPLHSKYIQARVNAMKVIAMLCVTEGIVANTSNIKSHYDWSGKNCPSKMRQDNYWPTFVQGVITEYNRLTGTKETVKAPVAKVPEKKKVAPAKKQTTTWTKVTGKWTGQSLFKGEYGQPVGEMQKALADNNPPFYPNKSAKNNGIDEYFGDDTEDQVTRFQSSYGLVEDGIPGKAVYAQVQANKPKKAAPKKTVEKGDMKTTSVVDYLISIDEDSSIANRKKLAKKHNISNYTGTENQNLKLLKKLRGSTTATKKKSTKKKVTSKGTVRLPASAETWKTYKLSVQPVSKNSDWSLTPSRYGGVTYDIIDEPYPNVVTINTSKGKRNIFVGPGTGAVIK